jgi:hypothetical protein
MTKINKIREKGKRKTSLNKAYYNAVGVQICAKLTKNLQKKQDTSNNPKHRTNQ